MYEKNFIFQLKLRCSVLFKRLCCSVCSLKTLLFISLKFLMCNFHTDVALSFFGLVMVYY